MRHTADAPPDGGRHQRPGRRAGVRRAMVPEDREPGGGITRPGVINVQRALVTQHKISLRDHQPSLTTAPQSA